MVISPYLSEAKQAFRYEVLLLVLGSWGFLDQWPIKARIGHPRKCICKNVWRSKHAIHYLYIYSARDNADKMYRIPSNGSGESVSIATRIRTRRNIVKSCEARAIQPIVEEAEWGLAIRNQVVIQQRDDACDSLYQLVPLQNLNSSLLTTTKLSACAEMSKKTRPTWLANY